MIVDELFAIWQSTKTLINHKIAGSARSNAELFVDRTLADDMTVMPD